MYKIRQIQYSSKSVSVQVYTILNRKRVILRHIGTARTEKEKADLITLANDFIEKLSKQLNLFENKESGNILHVSQTEFIGVYYGFLYELLSKLVIKIGFDKIRNVLLTDLSIIRIFEPASKLRSIELLEDYFGIKHRRQGYYESAPKWLDLKGKIEKIAIAFAKKNYSFNYDLLFYDVTTLYFETFEEDEFRKDGFSKDNKSQQPQVLVALLVTKEGFPIAYEVFPGNTFEGHTILPVVQNFILKNQVKEFTVVADAAMISAGNIRQLTESNINYIVGARLGNISNELFLEIDRNIIRKDGKTIRIKTELGYLICGYSSLRYRKDKHEMEKQIEKAKQVVENPSKSKKLKFTKAKGQNIVLNQELIARTQKLLGIKGYYTNLEEATASNQLIMERYHELYRIEQAFRISKHDLQTRPIFHFKEEPIKLHILICFVALVISKHIELQTDTSIKKIIYECKKVTDARLLNKITNREIRIRVKLSEKIIGIMMRLSLLT
ncbi:MAG TPA: IS1634 family transposase [Candidatus Gastranaerophilaceae bacterium]|nr:IS1634 family transposase [Candidatus Gastranaerophilaceae bacterium]